MSNTLTRLSMLLTLALILMAPFLFANLLTSSLAKLHLTPGAAVLLTVAIFVGGFINIPLKRVETSEPAWSHPLGLLGMTNVMPQWRMSGPSVIVAVNVGGCLIPAGLAVYQLAFLAGHDPRLTGFVLAGALVNIAVCYAVSRPVEGVGIVMPGFVPALVAALLGLLLAPEEAAPAAFIIGVAGPLIGGDLFHLRNIERLGAGIVSIGGAGTFDGILLSAIVAAYLA
jgi:uncharacterized membrane protein